jgi:hypothetical protein
MRNILGARLSRLVKENAYSKGKVVSLGVEIASHQSELKTMRKSFKTAQESVLRTERLIAQLSGIDVAQIRPIQSMPRVMQGKHGEFRREIVRLLKEANGPVRTSELMRVLIEEFQLPISTVEERTRAREKLRGPLLIMQKRGAIRRLPSPDAQGYGVWEWVGNDSP